MDDLKKILGDEYLQYEKILPHNEVDKVKDGRYDLRYNPGGFELLPKKIKDRLTRTALSLITYYVNRALLKIPKDLISLKLNWKDEEQGLLNSIQINLLTEEYKLSDLFLELPFGLIKKSITGIGATTLELMSDRNSIIVVPTKRLAIEKCKQKIDLPQGVCKPFYVGSDVDDKMKSPSKDEIECYAAQKDKKKFIVVANSVDRLIKILGKKVYYSYFYMLDEIDSYQAASTYRVDIEQVVDYFFKFKNSKRCMVSATVQEFSDPRINNLPVIDIKTPNLASKEVILTHTDRPTKILTDCIINLFNRGLDKIVVAYNRKSYIQEVIEGLPIALKEECMIMCSDRDISDSIRPYYGSLTEDSLLEKRITFITSTYFSGIDIWDKFHLISVSNASWIYTLLSPEQLKQIAGRGRNVLLSERIIYSTRKEEEENRRPPKASRERIEYFAKNVLSVAVSLHQVERKYPDLLPSLTKAPTNDFINRTAIYCLGNKIRILRKDAWGEPAIGYLCIDAYYQAKILLQDVYAHKEQLPAKLSEMGYTIQGDDQYADTTEDQLDIAKGVRDRNNMDKEKSIERLFSSLVALHRDGQLNQMIFNRKSSLVVDGRFARDILKIYQKVCAYMSMEDALSLFSPIISSNIVRYRNLYRAVIYWALHEKHPVKTSLESMFSLEKRHTKEEILENLNIAFKNYQVKFDMPQQAIRFIHSIMKPSKDRHGGLKLLAYTSIPTGITPINKISAQETDIKNLFEL